jgi:cellulose synthase/poly-beta-1,6-N-acetylglucosamine synthase-like glycosyltransferase
MGLFQAISVYFFLFVGIYLEVFILYTYIAHRRAIKEDGCKSFERSGYPSVTIAVPVWNEEKTVEKTVQSLLNLNYPKDRLKIVVVDDGSTDDTWNLIQKFKGHPQIEVHHKENGGKHTAVNYAIEHSTAELIGCLDADSTVHPHTLKKLVCRFDDSETMAVTPAMKILNPRSIVQGVQSIEYLFGILVKKVMGILGAIHVTPGPFTIFRRSMFETIGKFRKAHNTEDMEIAFRMQSYHLKIDNVHNAWVYTTGPDTFKKLYKQRLRWTFGFIKNAWDYKYLFFNKKYGNIGLLTLPTASALILAVLFSVFFLFYRMANFWFEKFAVWRTVGFLKPNFELSLFYVSTKFNIFLTILVFTLMFTMIYTAIKLTEEKIRPMRVISYFALYPIISPFWVIKSIYNAVFARKTSWR